MKHNYFIAILLVVFLISCSSDDNSNQNEDLQTGSNYFPVENGDFWTYDVTGTYPGRDSLYIANDTTINNTIHQKFKTKEYPFGFYSGSLAGNGVRKSGDQLMVSGSTGVNLIEGFPIDLAISDFIIFKESASENQQLSTTSGTFTYDYEGFPLKFDYTMKSIAGPSLASYNVPNYGSYDDVKVVKITVNLKISTVIDAGGVNFPIDILSSQDVVVSNQYYAKNIGMIYCASNINYELEDFSLLNIDFTFPTSGNQTITEFLDDYNVTNLAD